MSETDTGVRTVYHVIRPDGTRETLEVMWPRRPRYLHIKELVTPLLDDEPFEHVSVLHENRRRDMFVSEIGHRELTTRGPLPINPKATAIYRTYPMERNPDQNPDDLPTIAGVAVLFDRIVWT